MSILIYQPQSSAGAVEIPSILENAMQIVKVTVVSVGIPLLLMPPKSSSSKKSTTGSATKEYHAGWERIFGSNSIHQG